MEAQNDVLLTPREAAAALSVSINTLRAWRQKKVRLRYLRQGYRVWYRQADVDAYRQAHYRFVEVDE